MILDNVPIDQLLPSMLQATGMVLKIFFFTLLFSVPIGLLVALARNSRYAWVRGPVRIYQLIFRGTPLMLQLIFFMYAPFYIFDFSFGRFEACIIAFVVNYAAYFGEIFRGGMDTIPKGQFEAAKVLGYSKSQTFIYIILPQVIKAVIPAMGNECMTLVKDTSLAQVISVGELFHVAFNAGSKYFSTVPIIVASIFYLVMNTVVEMSFKYLERRFKYDR